MERLITAGEIKNWFYCPRVVYYRRKMPEASKPTFKMQEAIRAQDLIERLEIRRTLKAYGLVDGYERRFDQWLSSEELGMTGRLDLLLQGPDEAIPVDFKLTAGEPGVNHRMQLGAYAVLVEAVLGLPCRRAYLYRIPDDRVFLIEGDSETKERVRLAATAMREMDELEELPEATELRSRCEDCEYANFCGDVW